MTKTKQDQIHLTGGEGGGRRAEDAHDDVGHDVSGGAAHVLPVDGADGVAAAEPGGGGGGARRDAPDPHRREPGHREAEALLPARQENLHSSFNLSHKASGNWNETLRISNRLT